MHEGRKVLPKKWCKAVTLISKALLLLLPTENDQKALILHNLSLSGHIKHLTFHYVLPGFGLCQQEACLPSPLPAQRQFED